MRIHCQLSPFLLVLVLFCDKIASRRSESDISQLLSELLISGDSSDSLIWENFISLYGNFMYMTTYTTRLYHLQKNHKEFMYCLHIFRSIHLDRYTHLTDFQLYHCSTVGIQKVAYKKQPLLWQSKRLCIHQRNNIQMI